MKKEGIGLREVCQIQGEIEVEKQGIN